MLTVIEHITSGSYTCRLLV